MSKIMKCIGLLLPLTAVMLTSCKGENVKLKKYKNEVSEAEFFKAYAEAKDNIIKTTTNEDYGIVMTSTYSKNNLQTKDVDYSVEAVREINYDADNMALEFKDSAKLFTFGKLNQYYDVMYTATQSDQNVTVSANGSSEAEKINQYNSYKEDLKLVAKSYLTEAVNDCKLLPTANNYFKFYVDKNVFTMVMEYTGSEALTDNKTAKNFVNQVVIKKNMISEYQSAEFEYTSDSIDYVERTLGTTYIKLTNRKVKQSIPKDAVKSSITLPLEVGLS